MCGVDWFLVVDVVGVDVEIIFDFEYCLEIVFEIFLFFEVLFVWIGGVVIEVELVVIIDVWCIVDVCIEYVI